MQFENTKIICSQCKYVYHSSLQYWEKRSITSLAFELSLSNLIADFPIPLRDDLKSYLFYYQRIKDAQFYEEGLIYWSTKKDFTEIQNKIGDYLKQKQIFSFSIKNKFKDRIVEEIKNRFEKKIFSMQITHYLDTEAICISVGYKNSND